ncbi:MAG: hypothetical protein FJ096_12105 [Deltaproteobacteria bacterium]|nr:hypothetical protein [Deltaproteobacteria bacterium]
MMSFVSRPNPSRVVRWLSLATLGAGLVSAGCGVRLGGRATSNAAGNVPCSTSEGCPVPASPCQLAMCSDGECAVVPAPRGLLPESLQSQGDCSQVVCDGVGRVTAMPFLADVPQRSLGECSSWSCRPSGPVAEYRPVGTACSRGVCNGRGRCGECAPGTTRCTGSGIQQCDPNGQWLESAACPDDRPLCIGGIGGTTAARTGTEARCIGVKQLRVGAGHSCASFDDGAVRCWGADNLGQASGSQPWDGEALDAAARFRSFALGPRHACGLDDLAQVWCWGANDFGQLGTGDFVSSAEPRLVEGVSFAVEVVVGRDHTCARDRDGAVTCWGRNDLGQLGFGTALDAPIRPIVAAPGRSPSPVTPHVVEPFEDALELQLTRDTTCVNAPPRRKCFGARDYDVPPTPVEPRNSFEKLKWKLRLDATSRKPRAVLTESPARGLSAWGDSTCLLDTDGAVTCWGPEAGVEGAAKPRRIEGVAKAVDIGVGDGFGCARTMSGPVLCWGKNDRGQLGRQAASSSDASNRTVAVPLRQGALSLGVGDAFVCVKTVDRQVICWGDGRLGQINGVASDAPLPPTRVRW